MEKEKIEKIFEKLLKEQYDTKGRFFKWTTKREFNPEYKKQVMRIIELTEQEIAEVKS